MNCGWGSSEGEGSSDEDKLLTYSTTILGVSPLGLPLPLAPLTVLPPLEFFWKW